MWNYSYYAKGLNKQPKGCHCHPICNYAALINIQKNDIQHVASAFFEYKFDMIVKLHQKNFIHICLEFSDYKKLKLRL